MDGHRRQAHAARPLNGLSVLGEAVDIRLVLSPSLDAHLEHAHPDRYGDYNGGHKKWNAWILPWWSPFADLEAPRTANTDENGVAPSSRVDDVLYQAALDLGLDPEYDLFATPVDVDDVFEALPALDRWRGFILSHYDPGGSDRPLDRARHSPDALPTPDHTVEIGSPPTGRDHEQTSLSVGD